MSINQILFALPSADYMAFINGIQSSETAAESHEKILSSIYSCLDGESRIEHVELDVTGPALHWTINELTQNSMGVGWAVMGRPLDIQMDTDISGVLHNKQVALNNSILSNIPADTVRSACAKLPAETYRSEALRSNTDFVSEKFEQLKSFYSQAAADDNAVISYCG